MLRVGKKVREGKLVKTFVLKEEKGDYLHHLRLTLKFCVKEELSELAEVGVCDLMHKLEFKDLK